MTTFLGRVCVLFCGLNLLVRFRAPPGLLVQEGHGFGWKEQGLFREYVCIDSSSELASVLTDSSGQ